MTEFRRFNWIGLLLLWTAVLAVYAQPMRFEPYEPGRAGLIVVLGVACLGLLFAGGRRILRRQTLTLLLWAVVLVIVAIFALSPSTAFMGDLIRRFGALTQLALISGAIIGAFVIARYGGGTLARLFWIAGIAVSAIAILQQARLYPTISPTYYPVRSSSVIGYPTYLGGWIYLCVLICVVYAPFRAHWFKQAIWWIGIAFIASALIPSGARTATLALGAGIFIGILLIAAMRRWRWILLVIAAGALASIIILPHLIGIEGIPLFQRLDLSVQGNATQDLRYSIWGVSLATLQSNPPMTDFQGNADHFSALRPWVGYGWDMQEQIYDRSPIASAGVDRSHNFWFDLLLSGGWITLVVRGGLILGIGLWALHRLKLLHPFVIVPTWIGIIVGIMITRNTIWLPMLVTFAGIGGLCVGLLIYLLAAKRAPTISIDRPALLAIMSIVAFLIDMQLGFETVLVGFTFWLALGGMFARAEAEPSTSELPLPILIGMIALGGAALLRQINFNAPSSHSASIDALVIGAILLASLVYLLWLDQRSIRLRDVPIDLLTIALSWSFGWIGAKASLPYVASLWDVAFVLGGSLLFGTTSVEPAEMPSSQSGRRSPLLYAAALIFAAVIFWWWIDMTGDIALRTGNILFSKSPTWQSSTIGTSLRFWDERAWLDSAAQELNAAQTSTDADLRLSALEQASNALAIAERLHPFDAQIAPYAQTLQQIKSNGKSG